MKAVTGDEPNQISYFMVPRETPGFSVGKIEDKVGWRDAKVGLIGGGQYDYIMTSPARCALPVRHRVVCGEGSGDSYDQTTGVILGAKLGWPSLNCVSSLAYEGGRIVAVRQAGYETTTDFIWNFGPAARSFLFRDYDGNLIQLCEMTL